MSNQIVGSNPSGNMPDSSWAVVRPVRPALYNAPVVSISQYELVTFPWVEYPTRPPGRKRPSVPTIDPVAYESVTFPKFFPTSPPTILPVTDPVEYEFEIIPVPPLVPTKPPPS